jgi:hypothetical protein
MMPKYRIEYGLDVPAYGVCDIEADDVDEVIAEAKRLHQEDKLIDTWDIHPDVGCENYRVVHIHELHPETNLTRKCVADGFSLDEEEEPKFAQLAWMAGDVQTHKPDWTEEQCREWLDQNQKYIQDRLCELGNEVIGTLVELEDYEVK